MKTDEEKRNFLDAWVEAQKKARRDVQRGSAVMIPPCLDCEKPVSECVCPKPDLLQK